MEDLSFWKDLEASFARHSPRALDFHATHDETDFKSWAAQEGARLIALISDPSSDPDQLCSFARHVYRIAVGAQDRTDPNGYWVLSHGPKNDNGGVTRAWFDSLAERAAVAADLAGPEVTAEQAVQNWLHLLKRSETPYLKYLQMIEKLFDASELMCHELGTRIYHANRPSLGQTPDSHKKEMKAAATVNHVLPADNVFRRLPEGDWEVAFGDEPQRGIKNVNGMGLIRSLLEKPFQEIAATELAPDRVAPVMATVGVPQVVGSGLNVTMSGGSDITAPDEEAKKQYRRETERLQSEREEATARGNSQRADELLADIEMVQDQFTEKFSPERARTHQGLLRDAARKRALVNFNTALGHIREKSPATAEHLKLAVSIGVDCAYRPSTTIPWLVE